MMPAIRTVLRLLFIAAFMAAAAPGAVAAQSAAPSPADVLGYAMGERFTDHGAVLRYMHRLADASALVDVREYGTSVEGRPLVQVLIASERHRARLDEILERNRSLTDPELPEATAREIAASNPAVLYFSYGVHGNESSSSEAALWTAWDLARGAAEVAHVLDSAIVVIDPAVNPDGRDRYVQWYKEARQEPPNPNPSTREHSEPWPGGRANHYLFDLNRDWAWLSQPETRARLATWERWSPQVHIDFHEMSPRSTYFFFPATAPINPLYPEHTLEWGEYFGDANAAAFDERGWLYFTDESYDLFYPGYGDSWPSLVGAIGMTYEQAGGGSAGLAYERPDGTVLTLRDRALRHRTTGQATLRAATARKTELLLSFAAFHRDVDEGLSDFLLVPGPDSHRIESLVALLREQGIRVERAGRGFGADARAYPGFDARGDFPAGTYLVRSRQPRGRLAATLLQPEIELDASFSYDISAWSLPFAYGVEAHELDRVPDADWVPLPGASPVPGVAVGAGEPAFAYSAAEAANAYGFLVEPSFAIAPALVRYLRSGGTGIVLDEPVAIDGRDWPAGTIFLPSARNDSLPQKLSDSGLEAFAMPIQRGLTAGGIDLGSGTSYGLSLPRVAVLAGEGVSSTSYGAHWFFLEHTLGLPFDALPVSRLGGDLSGYDVIVVPEGGRVGGSALEGLTAWVRGGGTVVAVGSGARSLAESLAEIETRSRDDDAPEDEVERLDRALRGREARQEASWQRRVPGVILQATLDPAHPLAFGIRTGEADDRMFVLSRGSVFEPEEEFETVAYIADTDKISGVISDENLETLQRGTWLATTGLGGGNVILFADDPIFRHFWYAAYQPYVNALLLGPEL